MATFFFPLLSKLTGPPDLSTILGRTLSSLFGLTTDVVVDDDDDDDGLGLVIVFGTSAVVGVMERLSLLLLKRGLGGPLSDAGSILMMPDLMRLARFISQRVLLPESEVSLDLKSAAAAALTTLGLDSSFSSAKSSPSVSVR
jgi:hypothetical protein